MELVPTTLAHIPFARRLLASIDITRHTYFRITAEYLDDASLLLREILIRRTNRVNQPGPKGRDHPRHPRAALG
jgi:hypothetical protein